MSGPPGTVPVEEWEYRLLLRGAGWEMCSLPRPVGTRGGDRSAATGSGSLLGLADPVCVCVLGAGGRSVDVWVVKGGHC